ncbi:potassium channel subfamily T member 2-like isoform X4 [Convolutriloba macropyga]|uniref:potassium channel subfamily T member 2-like isoform X4 n=1 Tax=Convolutriloba macropyga TaxID=536237 RepID=UPI003F51C479
MNSDRKAGESPRKVNSTNSKTNWTPIPQEETERTPLNLNNSFQSSSSAEGVIVNNNSQNTNKHENENQTTSERRNLSEDSGEDIGRNTDDIFITSSNNNSHNLEDCVDNNRRDNMRNPFKTAGKRVMLIGRLRRLKSRVRIQFYTHVSTKEKLDFVWNRNFRTAFMIRSILLILKLVSCTVYVANFVKFETPITHCYDCKDTDASGNVTYPIYGALLWIERSLVFYIIEVSVAVISVADTIVLIICEFRGNIVEQIISYRVLVEFCVSVPFIASLCHPLFRYLYVPSFLNCWLAKMFLINIWYMEPIAFSSMQRLLMKLTTFITCLAFTCMCGIHYLERIQDRSQDDDFDFFNSFWFVIVTFSTVGYGDLTPIGWISKLFVIFTIGLALIFIPVQLEALSFAWGEKQKLGGNYSHRRAEKEKHVVLCTSNITEDILNEFMSEFYAYPKLQNYYVVLLCPLEFDGKINAMLENPSWSQRVIYIQGSALRVSDLVRAKVHYAESCFIFSSRNVKDRRREDEATILRTWAIKDFASHVPLYVQILQPEHKQLVMCANYVICEDELKYAVLASNCVCPAMSTYISLLVHTLQGRNPSETSDQWEMQYARSTAQEIYDKTVDRSKFFKEYIGYNFMEAAFLAHRKYGCMTIGVKPENGHLMLNPGPNHILRATDTVYFFYTTSEDETEISVMKNNESDVTGSGGTGTGRAARNSRGGGDVEANNNTRAGELFNKLQQAIPLQQTGNSFSGRPPNMNFLPQKFVQDVVITSMKKRRESVVPGSIEETYIEGYPTAPYPCFQAPICYLLPENRKICCLNLFKPCEHDPRTCAAEHNFKNPVTILCVEVPAVAICNFIVPLRHHCRERAALTPIIIMTENNPDVNFLAAISYYPLVYYCIGRMETLNDLIRAGVTQAETLVIVDKESSKFAEESYMADSGSVVNVYYLSRMFPDLEIITELTYPANMRFLGIHYSQNAPKYISFSQKKALEATPQDQDLFRPAFVSGSAISTSMLDTLLYQSYVKPYIISVIYLLIGLKQNAGSGTLIFRVVGETCGNINNGNSNNRTVGGGGDDDSSGSDSRTESFSMSFSEYYQEMIEKYFEIPIGIYRSMEIDPDKGAKFGRKTSRKILTSGILQNSQVFTLLNVSSHHFSIWYQLCSKT